MLLKFKKKNVGPMEDKELVFAPHVNVFTGDNSLGKSFLLDLLWFGLTRVWPADLNRRLAQGLPARPRDITAQDSSLEYVFRSRNKNMTRPVVFTYDKERMSWKAGQGKKHKAGLIIYAMADGSYAVWDPIQNYSPDEHDKKEYDAYVLSPAELWPSPPKRDGSTEIVEKSSFCNGVLKDWAKWQGATKDQHLFDLMKIALKGLTPAGDIVDFPELEDAETASGDDQPVLKLKYGNVLLKHASSSIRRMAALAYVLVWAISQHAKAAKYRGLKTADQIIILADEIETHLHPRWQRSVMDGLIKTVEALCKQEKFQGPDVQMFVSTHSPLVMAALEDVFYSDQTELPFPDYEEQSQNRWFDLDITDGGEIKIDSKLFRAEGRVESWLDSEAFDVHSTYSLEIERRIKDLNDLFDNWSATSMKYAIEEKDLFAEVRQKIRELNSRLPIGDKHVYGFERRLMQLAKESEAANDAH